MPESKDNQQEIDRLRSAITEAVTIANETGNALDRCMRISTLLNRALNTVGEVMGIPVVIASEGIKCPGCGIRTAVFDTHVRRICILCGHEWTPADVIFRRGDK